jgi:hypothetical protein
LIITADHEWLAALTAAKDTTGLKVVASPASSQAKLRKALSGMAEADSGHAWVTSIWIRPASGHANCPEWLAAFSKRQGTGLVRESEGALRAHIEWAS